MKYCRTIIIVFLLFISLFISGCKKNSAKELVSKIAFNDQEVITESFFLPKTISNHEDVVIAWESSDDDVIKIVDENDDYYKAIVKLPAYETEMELIAIINDTNNSYEHTYTVMVAKEQYSSYQIDELTELQNGELVKLDVIVVYREDSIFAINDGVTTMVFKQDNNYQVGDNLIIKAKMNNKTLDEINIEIINRDINFDPFLKVELAPLSEVIKLYQDHYSEIHLYSIIGLVSKVNNEYCLVNPFNESEFLEFEPNNDVNEFEGKIIKSLVLASPNEENIIKIISAKEYLEYEYYYEDYQNAKLIIEDLNRICNGILTSDVIIPEYQEYNAEVSITSVDASINDGKITHPGIDTTITITIEVKIGEAIICEEFDIQFMNVKFFTIKEIIDEVDNDEIVLILGEIISINENGIIIQDSTGEILVLGLSTKNIGDNLYIKGTVIKHDDVINFKYIESKEYEDG